MKLATGGLWRPLRWLLIFICAGSAVLAAESTWQTSLRAGHFKLSMSDWLSLLDGDDSTTETIAALPATAMPAVEPTMTRWVDSALFSRPATGWALDSTLKAVGPLVQTQSAPGPA